MSEGTVVRLDVRLNVSILSVCEIDVAYLRDCECIHRGKKESDSFRR